ncbi:MAG: hypothetical protein QM673_06100 [Gordonia sp. (in: high G+C Gram-positive bacteria)]
MLLIIGIILVVAPLAGGLFSDVAAGKQMLDEFSPRLQAAQLDSYRDDVTLLRDAATGLSRVYAAQSIPSGAYPAIDDYRAQSPAILRRADDLLARITSGVPNYRRVAAIGGFDRIPLLLLAVGTALIIAGSTLLFGRSTHARRAWSAAGIAGLVLVAYPWVGGLVAAGNSGEQMLRTLAPVMTAANVRTLQNDFVVVVTAVGVLDTEFTKVHTTGTDGAAINALRTNWPRVSGDLADLVGTVNNNLDNYDALRALDAVSRPVGISGFVGLGWLLLTLGLLIALVAAAGLIRQRRPAKMREKPRMRQEHSVATQ